MSRRRFMEGTASVPLHSTPSGGMESQQVEDLLHGDPSANSVKVDAWHPWSSLSEIAALWSWLDELTTRGPFRSHSRYRGTGTPLPKRSVESLPTTGCATEPAGSVKRLQHFT